MRTELIYTLRQLSDPDFQRRIWCRKTYDPAVWPDLSDFEHVVFFLYDDTRLQQDARLEIGNFLNDEQEAQLLRTVMDAINNVLADTGDEAIANDEVIIAHPKWPTVVDAARAALAQLESSDQQASDKV
jgi:hypothetical protein